MLLFDLWVVALQMLCVAPFCTFDSRDNMSPMVAVYHCVCKSNSELEKLGAYKKWEF